MKTPLLEVHNLKIHFPIYAGIFRRIVNWVKAVDGISFSIQKGEVLGMVGESGCGKSTIGRSILGLNTSQEGTVSYCGENFRSMPKQRRKEIQMVFQDPYASLNPRKSILDNIGGALIFHKLVSNNKEKLEKVAAVLDTVGMSADTLSRYPHEFSGGQQQRICIARALVLDPKLIICDEAVSGLDVSVQAQVLNLLSHLKETKNLSYLFISHDLSIVRYICDQVVVLYLGKIVESAPTQELFTNPKHPYTQALLAAIPKAHPNDLKTPSQLKGETPSPINPPKGCPFHPRCPYAETRCSEAFPPLKTSANNHQYQCILER